MDPAKVWGPDPNALDNMAGSLALISTEDEWGDNDNNDTVVQGKCQPTVQKHKLVVRDDARTMVAVSHTLVPLNLASLVVVHAYECF